MFVGGESGDTFNEDGQTRLNSASLIQSDPAKCCSKNTSDIGSDYLTITVGNTGKVDIFNPHVYIL